MRTFKEITQNYKYIAFVYFKFKSQSDVRYVITGLKSTPSEINVHLSKDDLIVCINFFLERLSSFSFSDRIKKGFVLDKFKYYELSVYLHGILQLYAANLCMPPVGELYIEKFSHLPHDILEVEKTSVTLQVSLVNDFFGGSYYTCVISGVPLCSDSLTSLKVQIFSRFRNLCKKHHIVLDVK